MELCGERVKHKVFGAGQIIAFENNHVTVLFEQTKVEKKFSYPSTFGVFLELENQSFFEEIEEAKNIIAQKEAEQKRINEENAKFAMALKAKEDEKTSKKTTKKAASKCNVAFKCNYCDGDKNETTVGYKNVCSDEMIRYNIKEAKHVWCRDDESLCNKYQNGDLSRAELEVAYKEDGFRCRESKMLKIWRAYAGITQSGVNKGKPMKLKNVKIDSLALLTTRLPHTEDEERFIFAVFLVNENYESGNQEEGYVNANAKYRLELSPVEAKQLKFWNYYFNPNKPERILFGSGLHRYLTDVQAAQVLRDICEIKKGSEDEAFAKEFLVYYCKIKGLDRESIPAVDGALQKLASGDQAV